MYTTFLYKHLPEMKTITTHVLTESKVYVNVFLKFELYAFLAYCTVSEEINAFINRLNHNWYNTKKTYFVFQIDFCCVLSKVKVYFLPVDTGVVLEAALCGGPALAVQ